MPIKRGTITIKRSPGLLIKLGAEIYSKHQLDGESSPLKSLVDNNWEITGPKIATCLHNHQKADELKRQMELAYKERDKVLVEIEGIGRNSAALLKGIYRNTPKKLTDWGFEVNETPAAKKTPAP